MYVGPGYGKRKLLWNKFSITFNFTPFLLILIPYCVYRFLIQTSFENLKNGDKKLMLIRLYMVEF